MDRPIPSEHHSHILDVICNDYFLNTAISVSDAFAGDLVKGMVFLAIRRANAAGVPHDINVNRLNSTLDNPPAPTTVYSVAKTLGLTYETARRHVNWLIDQGHCTRTPRGVVISPEALTQPAMVRGRLRNHAHFKHFLAELSRAGLNLMA